MKTMFLVKVISHVQKAQKLSFVLLKEEGIVGPAGLVG
jgi:hypothetical protein